MSKLPTTSLNNKICTLETRTRGHSFSHETESDCPDGVQGNPRYVGQEQNFGGDSTGIHWTTLDYILFGPLPMVLAG